MAFLYFQGGRDGSRKVSMCWREVHKCWHMARLETTGLAIKRKSRVGRVGEGVLLLLYSETNSITTFYETLPLVGIF